MINAKSGLAYIAKMTLAAFGYLRPEPLAARQTTDPPTQAGETASSRRSIIFRKPAIVAMVIAFLVILMASGQEWQLVAAVSPAPVVSVYLPSLSVGNQEPTSYRVYVPFVGGPERPTPTPTASAPNTAMPSPTATPTGPSSSSAADVVRTLEQQPLRPLDSQSKIGIGVYADGGGYVLNETLEMRPGVVLLMDPNPEFAREVRRQLPKAFIIGRRFVEYQPLDNPESRGAAFADHVAKLAVPLKGIVDAWMSYNEPVGRGDIAGYQAYNAFQVAFAKRLQGTYGIGAVAGNDPPGAIDVLEYPRYFGEAIRISKFFGIHAYSSPESRSLREPDAAWHALRYRKIYGALANAGIKSGPVVLTEVGLAKGWREMRVNEEDATADLMWFADEVAKDGYVMGFAIFGIFNTPGWEGFDLGGTTILGRLGRYDPARPLSIQLTPTSLPKN